MVCGITFWENIMQRRLARLYGALSICILAFASLSFAADDADAFAPVLKGEPSVDGLITWWLMSPLSKQAIDKVAAPTNVREGDPAAGTDGKWSLYISPTRSVSFRNFAPNAGVVFAYARINSLTGGTRRIAVASCGAVKVFLNGQCCLDKAQPLTPVTDQGEAAIELPKGMSELCVVTSLREGYITNFQFAIKQATLNGLKPATGDIIVIPTVQGKEPDVNAALLTAMTFTTKEAFVRPGDKIMVAAYILGSVPWNLGQLTPAFADQDGTSLPPDAARTASELGTRSFWQTQYTVPPTNGSSISLSLQVKSADKTLGTKTVSLYCKPGIDAAAAALSKAIAARAAKANRPLPNASLYAEKALFYLSRIDNHDDLPTPNVGQAILECMQTASRCADAEEQGLDPWSGKIGYFEKAYQSTLDNSAQPYQIQVPHVYEAAKKDGKKYPLVVFLHGYVPYYDRHHWWDETPEFDAIFDKHDCFLVLPFGRSNTDFQSCGETDVLDVLADVKRLYPIDDTRVYLYGYSMGAMGVYTIGAHHPDLFAAGVALAGRADSPLQNFKPLETFAPYKQWLIHADNPISLCENLMNLPLRIYHGQDDTIISVNESRRMEKRLKEVGDEVTLNLGPGSHGYGLEIMFRDEPVSWLLSHTRPAITEHNSMKAYRLAYAKQGAVQVLASTGLLQPITLEWTTKDGVVTFQHESPEIVQRSINGNVEPKVLDGLHKNPAVCGPVREAICSPFLIVYGTKGNPKANAVIKRNAEQFAADWREFAKSDALIKADTDVTAEDKKTRNLFLFGEEQENAIHTECAAKLPFPVKDGNITIAGKTVSLTGKGIMYIYPSPLADAAQPHSVVICAGLVYGHDVSSNHKLDLVPDYLLFDDKRDSDTTNTNHAICAGFFNGRWEIDPMQMWWEK
jgi:dienelactone hydrolase